MLIHLEINNFALIDKLEFEPAVGFNVLTGETGAGKTIILDALGMILGDRADKDMIREGSNKAVVQGVFSLNKIKRDLKEEIINTLGEMGIDVDNEDDLILSREITTGKSLARINRNVLNLNNLREISRKLVDIHGQHEHQSLLNEKNHLYILDAYGGKELLECRKGLEKNFNEMKEKEKELEFLRGDPRERERKLDLLKFQLDEIDDANLYMGEEEELYNKRKKLLNYERLKEGIYRAYDTIYKGEKESAVTDRLGEVISELNDLSEFDENIERISKDIETAQIYLEEAGQELGTYYQEVELDPYEIEEIESRIDKINDLKRKYGSNIDEILEYRNKVLEEIEWVESSHNRAEELDMEINQLKEQIEKEANVLSEYRKKTANKLAEDILAELKELAMEKVKFNVYVEESELNSTGKDKVEFLISPNPGEALKPLVKIASGGELARIMLALKTVLSKVDAVNTLIFDEIDTGISGKAAQRVGDKLEELAEVKQILCVTHLPQIACRADRHFSIFKQEKSGRTYTKVEVLEDSEQVYEIARMLDGSNPSEISLSHAKKMINKEN